MGENQTNPQANVACGKDIKPGSGRVLKRPSVAQVCILFSVTIMLFMLIAFRVQIREIYSGLLITEFGLIMLPALIFLLAFRFDLKAVLRLNGTRPLNFLVIFGIMCFAIPLAGLFNLLNLFIVNSIFGKVLVQQLPASHNVTELLFSMLVFAVSAGICEEFLFRGVIQRGLERFGAAGSILLSAFLFSITHMDFQKIFGTFFLGAIIGFIVYKTGSLYCGIFAHFANNAFALIISYAATKIMSMLEGSGMQIPGENDPGSLFAGLDSIPPQQLIIALFTYGFIFLFITAVFILLVYSLTRLNRYRTGSLALDSFSLTDTENIYGAGFKIQRPYAARTGGFRKKGFAGLLWLLPGIIMIAVRFYMEVYDFTGAENEFINAVKWLLGIPFT